MWHNEAGGKRQAMPGWQKLKKGKGKIINATKFVEFEIFKDL